MEEQTPGRIWYKLRGALIAPAYALTFFCVYRENETRTILALGIAFFAMGFFLRVWAQMHLHYRLKVHKVLTRTGPYVYVRNPIYIGNTLLLIGTTLMAELVWFAPIMLLACIISYSLTVHYEERHLSAKYGAPYREFLTQVPRWIPRLPQADSDPAPSAMAFLAPSLVAELHILLLLILPLTKELVFPHVGLS